jgi:hypothetical protein
MSDRANSQYQLFLDEKILWLTLTESNSSPSLAPSAVHHHTMQQLPNLGDWAAFTWSGIRWLFRADYRFIL